MNNENTSEKVKINIRNFDYSPEKQKEIDRQKAFLSLYYKNNYETILEYTSYINKKGVQDYYTIEDALRDYDILSDEILFEKRGYNVYSYLNIILNRIFTNENDENKKKELIKTFFTDYEKWKKMLDSKFDIDERKKTQENVSREFSQLNNDQDEYGYYDTEFEGGKQKYKRTTMKRNKKNKRNKKKSRKSKKSRIIIK